MGRPGPAHRPGDFVRESAPTRPGFLRIPHRAPPDFGVRRPQMAGTAAMTPTRRSDRQPARGKGTGSPKLLDDASDFAALWRPMAPSPPDFGDTNARPARRGIRAPTTARPAPDDGMLGRSGKRDHRPQWATKIVPPPHAYPLRPPEPLVIAGRGFRAPPGNAVGLMNDVCRRGRPAWRR